MSGFAVRGPEAGPVSSAVLKAKDLLAFIPAEFEFGGVQCLFYKQKHSVVESEELRHT